MPNERPFESLDPEEQARIFHQSPFKEKGELLLRSHDPLGLARSLSQEELYLVTKEMDLEERSEVVRYASLSQLVFISDMDCWKKDRVDAASFLNWLETLEKAKESSLLVWLNEMDYEAVVTGLKKLIQVLKPEREYPIDEVLGDRSYFTLDDYYYIFVEEENLETVRQVLEILYENYRGKYIALLEAVMAEIDDELEEDAYRKREMRLAERGFPEPEAARKIYRPMTAQEFEAVPPKKKDEGIPFQKSNMPHYPLLRLSSRLFFDEVLLLLREETEVKEGLEEELAWLSNKVIACDGMVLSSEEQVRRGVERARCLVSLGLQVLSHADLEQARMILKQRWLEFIFRWGLTQLHALKERALRISTKFWGGSRQSFLDFLDAPYQSIFAALLKSPPEFYDPVAAGREESLRDFRSLEDIEKSLRALVQIEKILQWVTSEVPNLSASSQDLSERTSPLSLFSLLGNYYVACLLGPRPACRTGGPAWRPLSLDQTRKFLKIGFQNIGGRRVLNPRQKMEFMSRLFSAEDLELLKAFWAVLFENLEEELARLDPSKKIEPRYISALSIAPDGPKRLRRKTRSLKL